VEDDTPIEHTPDSPGGLDDDEFKPFLVAPCAVEVREQPGGPITRYMVQRERLEPVNKNKKGNSGPSRFVLAGFDTEYQSLKPLYTHDEVVKRKEARYEVLSYQLFMKLDDHLLREIIVPNRHSRINFVDFITYALAKLTAAGSSIPRTWVLVGHFNKADFPAFADRGQTFRKLVAIRSSMVTLGYLQCRSANWLKQKAIN
jgi:hypothetical protein